MNQQPESGLTTADLAHAGEPAVGEDARLPKEANRAVAEESAPRMTMNRKSETAFFDHAPAEPGNASARKLETTGEATEEEYGSTPLLAPEEAAEFHTRWNSVQVSFVDEPRHAVEEADGLVAAAIKRLAEVFARERQQLDSQWDQGENVSTEDLRMALRRYRSFFGRLLSV